MKLLMTTSIIVAILSVCTQTMAQKTTFISAVDRDLTIKSITALPVFDNLSGIYAKPLSAHLNSLLENDRQWKLITTTADEKITPENLEDDANQVKALLRKSASDAIITTRIAKGPKGISIKMNLFAGQEGLLLAQSTLADFSGFELADLKTQLTEVYTNLKHKLPYDGTILSRKGLLVTIDIGANQGLRDDQQLNVIQIGKIGRHPKFKFLVSSEKEILGKIHLTKVEENLSFGTIESERDEGVVVPGQKLLVINYVNYPVIPATKDGKVIADLNQRQDSSVAFGQQAHEWVPEVTPTYGKVGVLFGLGLYQISNNLSLGGGVSATNTLTPSIRLNGEMWITPNWFGEFILREYIFSVNNPYSGSSPNKLNVSTNQYSLLAGYNFLVADQFFGPKLQLLAGYSKMSSVIDQSTPVAFTNASYGGLELGVGGSFPLALESKLPVSIGARLELFFLNPTLEETPVTSGSATNTVTSFNAFCEYRYSQRMNVKGMVLYDSFSSSLTGSGSRTESASSISHTMTTFAGGIEFLF